MKMTYEVYGRGGSIGEQKAYKKNNKTKFVSGLGEMFLLGKANTKDEYYKSLARYNKLYKKGD